MNQFNSFKLKTLLSCLALIATLFFSEKTYSQAKASKLDSIYNKIHYLRNSNTDSTIYYANLLFDLAEEMGSVKYKYKSFNVKIKALIKSGNHIEAIKLCMEAKKLAKDKDLLNKTQEVDLYLGQTYLAAGFASMALDLFLKIQESKNELNLQNQIDLDYFTGCAYYDIGEIEKGVKYVKQSIKTDQNQNPNPNSFSAFILLANNYTNQDSIAYYYDLANTHIRDNPEWHYQRVALESNLALFNDAISKKALAKSQYLFAIKLSKESGLDEFLSTNYNNYAYFLMDEEKFDSAKLVINKAVAIARRLNSSDLLSTIYDTYSDYQSAVENYKLALAYMDSSVYNRNLYREQKKIKESMFISTVFETDQMEKELLLQNTKINRLIITILTSLTVLIVLLGLFILNRQRLKLSRSELESTKRDRKLEVADALIKGQDNERKRIAMDLHDGLSAQIGTLGLYIDGFISSHKKYPIISSSVKTIHKTVRELSHRMIPSQLEKSGLVSAINNIVSSVKKTSEFEIELETNLTERLSGKIELNIYFLVLELVNNATKHSDGDSIFVQLIKHENFVNLLVEDNGSSFDANSKDGIGLKNIKTRVEYLGGKFTIDADNKETIIMINIPI